MGQQVPELPAVLAASSWVRVGFLALTGSSSKHDEPQMCHALAYPNPNMLLRQNPVVGNRRVKHDCPVSRKMDWGSWGPRDGRTPVPSMIVCSIYAEELSPKLWILALPYR